MLKLTTYRRDQFPNLKAKLEADGYTYASAMELCNTQKLASLCSEGPVALDVSPLLPLLNPTSCLNDTASVTEVLMHQLPDDTLFVADENATAGREYDMRTLFDEIEKSEIEGEPAEETMPVKRRAKLLIDLSSEKTESSLTTSTASSSARLRSKRRCASRSEPSGCSTPSASSRYYPCSCSAHPASARPRPPASSATCSHLASPSRRLTSATTAAKTPSTRSSEARAATSAAKRASSP